MSRRPVLPLLLCALLACTAGAERRDLSHTAERVDAYVRVPEGQEYREVTLDLRAASGRPTRLSVQIDGTYAATTRLPAAGESAVGLRLPALKPGVHRIEVSAAPEDEKAQLTPCNEAQPALLGVRQAQLSYIPTRVREPRLDELPDALFPRDLAVPAVGQLELIPANNAAAGAALAAAQMLGAFRRVIFQPPGGTLPPDFRLRVVQDRTLEAPARLSTAWGLLELRYRDQAGLDRAVRALGNPAYRAQLRTPNFSLWREVPALPAASLPQPRSLAEFGLTDLQIMQGPAREEVLSIPAAWEAQGPVLGTLHLTAPAGLFRSARFWAWSGTEVLTSRDLSRLDNGATELEAVLRGTRPLRGNVLPLKWQSDITGPESCVTAPSTGVWIDAQRSTLNLNLRPKAGLGGMSAALLAQPTVSAQGAPALALAATMAAALPRAGVQGGLPWQVVPAPQRATLTLSADPTVASTLDRQVAQAQGALVVREGERWLVRVPETSTFTTLARHWPELSVTLSGRAERAFAATDGTWISLDDRAAPLRPLPRYQVGWFVLLGLLLLAVTAALLLRQRPARKPRV